MENDTLVAYIATERARNVTDDNIRTELTTKGWGAAEIAAAIGNEAVASVSGTLPSFGALISSSWDKLLLHKKFFVVIGVCLTALSFLSSVASSMIAYASRIFDASTNSLAFPALSVFALVLLTSIINIIVGLWLSASVYTALYTDTFGAVNEALGKGWKNTGKYLRASFAAGLFIIVGFFLLFIPGIIFAVWYAFAGVIAVVEQKKMSESVKTSKAYVKGRWWPIFWRLIGICFITLIIQAIAWVLLRLLSITEIDGMNYIGTLVSAVIGAALALYFNVFFFELYKAVARTAAK